MTVIASSDDSLNLALEMKRRQVGETAWAECVDEARRREEVVLNVGQLMRKGSSFSGACREAKTEASESTLRRWMKRHEDHGLAGLISIKGQLPHGHPDPVIKTNFRRSSKPKSFIKWVGGKASALPEILQCFPKKYRRYYEPMVGSGVVFFSLEPEEAVLGDINHEIVDAFRVVRDHVEALKKALERHVNTSEHYFKVRAQEPDTLDPVDRAARFIYLNKTCYNGMYRVNRSGRFNVPYGRIGHANICDRWTLDRTSRMLQGVDLRTGGYRDTLADAGDGDLVYLDPPYLVPRSRHKRCHLYQPEAFGEEEHRDLATFVRELIHRGCHVVASNADMPEVHYLYAGLDIRVLEVRRPVNRNARARSGHRELLIVGRPQGVTARSTETASIAPAHTTARPCEISTVRSSHDQLALPLQRKGAASKRRAGC